MFKSNSNEVLTNIYGNSYQENQDRLNKMSLADEYALIVAKRKNQTNCKGCQMSHPNLEQYPTIRDMSETNVTPLNEGIITNELSNNDLQGVTNVSSSYIPIPEDNINIPIDLSIDRPILGKTKEVDEINRELDEIGLYSFIHQHRESLDYFDSNIEIDFKGEEAISTPEGYSRIERKHTGRNEIVRHSDRDTQLKLIHHWVSLRLQYRPDVTYLNLILNTILDALNDFSNIDLTLITQEIARTCKRGYLNHPTFRHIKPSLYRHQVITNPNAVNRHSAANRMRGKINQSKIQSHIDPTRSIRDNQIALSSKGITTSKDTIHRTCKALGMESTTQRRERMIWELYDASLTNQQNLTKMKEAGLEISERTLQRWKAKQQYPQMKEQQIKAPQPPTEAHQSNPVVKVDNSIVEDLFIDQCSNLERAFEEIELQERFNSLSYDNNKRDICNFTRAFTIDEINFNETETAFAIEDYRDDIMGNFKTAVERIVNAMRDQDNEELGKALNYYGEVYLTLHNTAKDRAKEIADLFTLDFGEYLNDADLIFDVMQGKARLDEFEDAGSDNDYWNDNSYGYGYESEQDANMEVWEPMCGYGAIAV